MFDEYSEEQRLIFCRAVVSLIAADGHLAEEERRELDDLIYALGFDPSWPMVARAVGTELLTPTPIGELVEKLEGAEIQAALLRLLVEVAWSDGELEPREREAIREAARVAGYDPLLADDLGALIRPPTLLPEDGLLFCEAAAAVMLSDDKETPEEHAAIKALGERMGIAPDEPALLAALADPPSVKAVAERVDQRAVRIYLMRILAEVAWADGELRYAEAAALDAAGEALGLDLPLTREIIRWAHAKAREERVL